LGGKLLTAADDGRANSDKPDRVLNAVVGGPEKDLLFSQSGLILADAESTGIPLESGKGPVNSVRLGRYTHTGNLELKPPDGWLAGATLDSPGLELRDS
jgi:hypothetical protein